MANNINYIKSKLNEKKYKQLNSSFQSIENNLFLKLDPLILSFNLSNKNVSVNYTLNFTIIFELNSKEKIAIGFDSNQKKIRVIIPDQYNNLVKKKCNVHYKEEKYKKYCFRYSSVNCNKIVNIIRTIFEHYEEA
jgi:hypothetical protein